MAGEISSSEEAIDFESFRLLPAQQLLLDGGKPVALGARALDILTVLVRRAGEVVDKDELIAQVWPGIFVEDGNVRVHIAALRRVLGEGHGGRRFLATVPGRGYSFIAPVSRKSKAAAAVPERTPAAAADSLPSALTRMVGRARVAELLIAQLPHRRFVTIVGPGGIGKTTVALAVADALSASHADGVRFVDLAPVTDSRLVPSALASALGLPIGTDNPIPGLIAAIKDKDMLLVLDSCEHVIDAAAVLAEEIFNGAPRAHILATSREALRAGGERVQRLTPLEIPSEAPGLTAKVAMTFSAVQLFVERASAALESFELSDAAAPIVAEICRRLDGNPLAIELAAGRVDTFGVRGVADRLDDRFRLLSHGHRTAQPRHQTLSAAIDWSYELLAEPERIVLRRLAVLAGSFTLEAASAIGAGGSVTPPDVADCVANLVSASLISADIAGEAVYYRLLDTTRAYARDKLVESGEAGAVARRHAAYFLDFFREAENDLAAQPAAERLVVYTRQLDNLRVALDWAFSSQGDAALAVELTASGLPLWLNLSLVQEGRVRAEQAILLLGPQANRDPRCDMQLHAVLGGMLLYTRGPGPEVNAAFLRALRIAEELGDIEYRLRTLWGLWTGLINNGDYAAALETAEKFQALAAQSANPVDVAVADRGLGFAWHFLGNQIKARHHLEQMMARPVGTERKSLIVRYQFDPLTTGRMRYAWVLWLLGYPDSAMRMIEANLDDLWSVDHPVSVCTAMGLGPCHVAIACGHSETAERYIDMMVDHATKHSLTLWQAWGRCMRGVVRIKHGNIAEGLPLLRGTLDQLADRKYALWYAIFIGNLAAAQGLSGDVPEGLKTINDAIAHAEQRGEGWHVAELTRIKGELLLMQASPDPAAAEALFIASRERSRREQTLSWELRAAMSLAGLCRNQGRIAQARDELQSVYGRFAEGFETADLIAAHELLNELA